MLALPGGTTPRTPVASSGNHPAKLALTSLSRIAAKQLASGSGDGYYGPCTIQRLADGSILIVRSGETKQGHYTMAQATLIKPDGSAVFAEDTNQANSTPSQEVKVKLGHKALPPTVSANPPVGASALADFVRDVAAQS